MDAVVFNALDSTQEHGQVLANVLKEQFHMEGIDYQWIDLRELDIKICPGCSSCAQETPGYCPQKDGMQEIYPKLVGSQLWVFVTPISFGGYHSHLKKAMDRLIPLKVGSYTLYDKELHHKNRYDGLPKFLTIGSLAAEDPEQRRVFASLTERNARNLLSSAFASVVVTENLSAGELVEAVKSGLRKVL